MLRRSDDGQPWCAADPSVLSSLSCTSTGLSICQYNLGLLSKTKQTSGASGAGVAPGLPARLLRRSSPPSRPPLRAAAARLPLRRPPAERATGRAPSSPHAAPLRRRQRGHSCRGRQHQRQVPHEEHHASGAPTHNDMTAQLPGDRSHGGFRHHASSLEGCVSAVL